MTELWSGCFHVPAMGKIDLDPQWDTAFKLSRLEGLRSADDQQCFSGQSSRKKRTPKEILGADR
jgi:hypothetical protein